MLNTGIGVILTHRLCDVSDLKFSDTQSVTRRNAAMFNGLIM